MSSLLIVEAKLKLLFAMMSYLNSRAKKINFFSHVDSPSSISLWDPSLCLLSLDPRSVYKATVLYWKGGEGRPLPVLALHLRRYSREGYLELRKQLATRTTVRGFWLVRCLCCVLTVVSSGRCTYQVRPTLQSILYCSCKS